MILTIFFLILFTSSAARPMTPFELLVNLATEEALVKEEAPVKIEALEEHEQEQEQLQLMLVYRCPEPYCWAHFFSPYDLHAHAYNHAVGRQWYAAYAYWWQRYRAQFYQPAYLPIEFDNHVEAVEALEIPEAIPRKQIRYLTQEGDEIIKKEAHQCNWQDCDEEFGESEDFYHHVNQHVILQQKNYACQWGTCSKTPKTRTELKRHLLVHTQEKPYVCFLCDKQFNTIHGCRNHVKNKVCQNQRVAQEKS